MGNSYQDLADRVQSLGGYTGEPNPPGSSHRDSFQELHDLLDSMYNKRDAGDCPQHRSRVGNDVSYDGGYSFGQMNDVLDNMTACSCNSRTQTVCNCDSRTTCECNTRQNYSCTSRTACSCNSRQNYSCISRTGCDCNNRQNYSCTSRTSCSCNSRSATDCGSRLGSCWCFTTGSDTYCYFVVDGFYTHPNGSPNYGHCHCFLRYGDGECFNRVASGFSCNCNTRTGNAQRAWNACWCMFRGSPRVGGDWGTWGQPGNACYCFYRDHASPNWYCDCQSRYAHACLCNSVNDTSCGSRTACSCNYQSDTICGSRTGCSCNYQSDTICGSRTACSCNYQSDCPCNNRTTCYCDGRCSCNQVQEFY